MFERILVPLDGSKLAELALPYAEELAARAGSQITLLRVITSSEAEDYDKNQVYLKGVAKEVEIDTKKSLEKPEGEIKVETAVLTGNPAEAIVDYAATKKISLIVMASHGRSGIGRWTLGSVAEKVVRGGSSPVLLVRSQTRG